MPCPVIISWNNIWMLTWLLRAFRTKNQDHCFAQPKAAQVYSLRTGFDGATLTMQFKDELSKLELQQAFARTRFEQPVSRII